MRRTTIDSETYQNNLAYVYDRGFGRFALRSAPAWGRIVKPNYWSGLPNDQMPLLEDVLEPLAALDVSSWTLDVVVFRVHAQ